MGPCSIGYGHDQRRPSTIARLNDKAATTRGFVVRMWRQIRLFPGAIASRSANGSSRICLRIRTCRRHGVSGTARCMKCVAASVRFVGRGLTQIGCEITQQQFRKRAEAKGGEAQSPLR